MRLTPAALFGPVPLAGPVPSDVKISPDGKCASYLRPADDNRERLELWLVDLASGEARRLFGGGDHAAPTLAETAEEKAERERRRQFTGGITAYEWHPLRNQILCAVDGAGLLVDAAGGAVRRVTPPNTRQSGIRYSATGDLVSYVRAADLYYTHVGSGVETRLTHDGGGTVSNGLPEFIAQEEMGRFEGHWWAPDDSAVAFARVDTAPIAQTNRYEPDLDGIDVIAQRYPFAGAANAEVRLGLAPRKGGETTWLNWRIDADDYLARVQFGPDGALYVQAQSRHQKRLALRRFEQGRWERIAEITDPKWVELGERLTVLKDGGLLWLSELDGGRLPLLSGRSGGFKTLRLPHPLHVDRVLAANDEHVWVTGHRDDPTQQHLYQVGLANGDCKPLNEGTWWEGVVNADHGVVVGVIGHGTYSVRLDVIRPSGGREIPLVAMNAHHPYFPFLEAHSEPQIGSLSGSSGDTLYYRLTKPSHFDASRRYPVVVHVYGGPGVQRVRQGAAPLALQLFAQAGFGVFELDNRGSANRDRDFEQAIHGCLGHVEVEDQLEGVKMLRTLAWVDPGRIGIFGHSYGGYMVLKCLANGIGFAAGVAVAPVTDWRLYDTHYTERYMGTPEQNPAGYAQAAVLPEAAHIQAPLLLMHGMADDNVLFTHSLRLIKALQDAGTPFELMTYPGAKHALQERSVAVHRYNAILDFFRRTLARS